MEAQVNVADPARLKRDGVELTDVAGVESSWSVPVALWHAPRGFDTSAKPDNQPHNTIAVRLTGSLVQRVEPGRGPLEKLSPNGFSIHPACQDLRFVARSEIRFAHLYLSEPYLRTICRELSATESENASILRDDRVMYHDDEMRELITAYLRRAFDPSDPPSRLEMDSRANLIALMLLKRHSTWGAQPDRIKQVGVLVDWQLRKVCGYMEENLHADIVLADLADLIDVSQEHFCRSFRRTTGMPPHRWLLHKRIARAQILLADSRRSLTQVAQDVGYAGQAAFGVAFRKVTGMSPGLYRRSL
jgi:AraC family transcriptional regulator